jgi:hypothetical protein
MTGPPWAGPGNRQANTFKLGVALRFAARKHAHAQLRCEEDGVMNGFGWGLRLMPALAGLIALTACSTMSESDRAAIEQARSDAQAAQAAADRAAAAADRAAASANEAADAASTAQMATERQQRMVQQTMRK